jgi:hypothetical protein
MTITASRVTNGELQLGPTTGGVDMSCQITNVLITSNYSDDGNAVTTLCGDTKPAGRKLDGRSLDGTFVQDWDDPLGITVYIWDNDLQTVAFTYTPDDSGLVITGTVMIEVPSATYGGDVNATLTSDFSWNMQDAPVFTYPAALAATAAKEPVSVGST